MSDISAPKCCIFSKLHPPGYSHIKMTGIISGNGDQSGCGLSFFFDSQEISVLNNRQVRVTMILMMMSHAVNIASVISFLIEFNTSGMTSFFNFFACIPNKRYLDSLKHGNFVLNTLCEPKICDLLTLNRVDEHMRHFYMRVPHPPPPPPRDNTP